MFTEQTRGELAHAEVACMVMDAIFDGVDALWAMIVVLAAAALADPTLKKRSIVTLGMLCRAELSLAAGLDELRGLGGEIVALGGLPGAGAGPLSPPAEPLAGEPAGWVRGRVGEGPGTRFAVRDVAETEPAEAVDLVPRPHSTCLCALPTILTSK